MRRRRGRLPWRDVASGPVYVGDLRSHIVEHARERYNVLRVQPSRPYTSRSCSDSPHLHSACAGMSVWSPQVNSLAWCRSGTANFRERPGATSYTGACTRHTRREQDR